VAKPFDGADEKFNSIAVLLQKPFSAPIQHPTRGGEDGLSRNALEFTLGCWDDLLPYVWLTRDKIADIRELRSKKIGVNRTGSKPWLITQVLLQDAGLETAKDLILLQIGGGSQERVAASTRRWRIRCSNRL
jgi:hypothetical protein